MDDGSSGAKPACILVLQGGGAMGAYHIGAYQALREQAFEPNWVCGISMGAINGAIIAGNVPERRLERLAAFWDTISRPSMASPVGGAAVRRWENMVSFAEALTWGQPGFFTPRPISPYLSKPGPEATSFYDTAPLYGTLADVIDFESLDKSGTRLSVGATDVETGTLEFFDSHRMPGRFGPEHVVASSSLPPGFPATTIGGRQYWDGGCVSNTPLQAVADDIPAVRTVVFLLDLFNANGPAPDTMSAVEWRAKQIRYATGTFDHVHLVAAKLQLLTARRLLSEKAGKPVACRFDIVHIIYRPGDDQIPASDAEFSRSSITARRAAGLDDMRRALAERPWERPERSGHLGCLIHRLTADGLITIDTD
jgi:NTE family protein